MNSKSNIRLQTVLRYLEPISSAAAGADRIISSAIRNMAKDQIMSLFKREALGIGGDTTVNIMKLASILPGLIWSENRFAKNLSRNIAIQTARDRNLINDLRKSVSVSSRRIDALTVEEVYNILRICGSSNLNNILHFIQERAGRGSLKVNNSTTSSNRMIYLKVKKDHGQKDV